MDRGPGVVKNNRRFPRFTRNGAPVKLPALARAEQVMDRILIGTIFAVVLAMAALLLLIGLAEAPPNAAGLPHPAIAEMRSGGDGAARLEAIGGYAFAFQSLLLLFAALLCTLSVSPARRSPAFLGWMAVTFLANMLPWQQMYFQHQAFLETGKTGWFAGFPAATAWQVYGVWFAGIALIAIYSAGFRHYILSENDEQRFRKLLRESGESRD